MFEMTVDLNVLNHLGIKLYSSIAAVLSEAVANAWDADAEKVKIDISKLEIVIADNGHGMSEDDLNRKFLAIGYQRRKDGKAKTPKGRNVFGRKGIGKLSLFSIADTIEVTTVKDGKKSGLILSLPDIQDSIEKGEKTYKPASIGSDKIEISRGTKITIKDIRKKTNRTPGPLRRRLARRFSTIGQKINNQNFDVYVNNKPVTVQDREYYKKVEFLWSYGEKGEAVKASTSPSEIFDRDAKFTGWIGTVQRAGDLISVDDDNLNDIQIMVRGRVAQEKTLQFFGEDGIYASYVVGEIHADWLDDDNQEDIATSNRQSFIEDDPRVIKLKKSIKAELKHVQSKWTALRNDQGAKEALKLPLVERWFKTLGPDQKDKAKQLFGKINRLSLEPDDKKPLFKYGILAFEKLRLKDTLSKIDQIKDDDLTGYLRAFENHDELESQLYYEISKGRLDIINKFEGLVDENKLEKVLQKFLFNHIWLLDPAWDRAATDVSMEMDVKKAILGTNKLDGEYMKEIGRIDIHYRKSGGEHIIIELKRAGRVLTTEELLLQVSKYRRKLKQLLSKLGRSNEAFEIVCLIGKDLSDWKEPEGRADSRRMLDAVNARVMTYKQLIGNARRAYSEYLTASEKAGEIYAVLEEIDASL